MKQGPALLGRGGEVKKGAIKSAKFEGGGYLQAAC